MVVLIASPSEMWELLSELVGGEIFPTDKMLKLVRDDGLLSALDEVALNRRVRLEMVKSRLAELEQAYFVEKKKMVQENRAELEVLRAKLKRQGD